ncbi:MAG: thermonuclease family protein [Candidatus Omnitrophica bacterium]|nr:thermonuclease family protein [Candidatus Omnitrophota bacterium]
MVISTGKKAKASLEGVLKEALVVVVKTYAIDQYGRYVADVFYRSGERDADIIVREGFLLNQKLLDEKIADYAG